MNRRRRLIAKRAAEVESVPIRAGAAVLATAILLIVPQAAQAAKGFPIQHGAYAEGGVHCNEAASTDLGWYGGGYVFQGAHAQCKLVSVRSQGNADFVVVERCLANADPSMAFRLVNHVHILGHRGYRLTNREGRFRYHWCHD